MAEAQLAWIQASGYANTRRCELSAVVRWGCTYVLTYLLFGAKGHVFGPHVDFSVTVGKHQSIYTVMVYLNDCEAFEGGTTDFFDSTGKKVIESIAPKAGLAIVFVQDDMTLLHEGTEVKGGKKYMIRTDVLFTSPHKSDSDEDAVPDLSQLW